MSNQAEVNGKFGLLTKDQFGFMPVTSKGMPGRKCFFRDFEVMTFIFETDEDEAVKWIPKELQLDSSPAIARIMCCHYKHTSVGRYNEVILGFNVLWQGEPRVYYPHLYVSGWVPMFSGREMVGFPKTLANITWKREEESILCYVERPEGKRIVTCHMHPDDFLDPKLIVPRKYILLKSIPGLEEGGLAVAQLIEGDSIASASVLGSDGKAEQYTGVGNVTYDSPCEFDPWYRISVNKMLACTYGRFNGAMDTQKNFRIIKDYLNN